MKNFVFVLLCILPFLVNAQLYSPNNVVQPTMNPSTGNVGIGSGSVDPTSRLVVSSLEATSATPWVLLQGGGSVFENISLRLFDTGTASGNTNILDFAHSNAGNAVSGSKIKSISVGSHMNGGANLVFETAANNSGTFNTNQFFLKTDGKVGIGTSAPDYKLEINGGLKAGNTFSSPAYNDHFVVNADGNVAFEGGQIFTNVNSSTAHGIKFSVAYSNSSDPNLRIGVVNLGAPTEFTKDYLFLRGGNIGIGTTDPDARLAVNGDIHATEVRVTATVPGPDYVFEKDYNLPTLDEIKAYIDEHKHLPEVPSAKEMEVNGINVGEMNMILLKKVEELTLHLISQSKQIGDQLERIEEQQQIISSQNNRIEKLEKALK